MLGNITEVRVEIRANNFTGNTDKLAVEVKFRLTKSIDSLPELSQERAQFENWFIDDVSGLLAIDRPRVQVETLSSDRKGTFIQILLLPSVETKGEDMQYLTSTLMNYAKNATSSL
uniref:Uncharacterized protein n=1 Tax=Lotharella globosa TaxID=91324 RepID=A0A6V3MZ70_9EUKA